MFSQTENREEKLELQINDYSIEDDTLLIHKIDNQLIPEYPSDFVVDSILKVAEFFPEQLKDIDYISRLKAINTPIELTFNDLVKSHIQLYSQRRKEQVERMLGLADYYFPIFEEALDAKNLPFELKYLPIIESALNPRALSRAGASGIWQFMQSTGKLYGLEINSYIDERRDPVKSTYAAVKYLSDLYDIYGDWHLAIAAYNCGPGNVNKAVRRAGGKQDFWEIYPLLPRETRAYVPAFIAATYIMTYAKEYGFIPRLTDLPEITDTIMVYQPLHFEQIAAILQVNIETIRDLNPQYRRDIIPANEKKSYPLKLTAEQTLIFASYEDSIYNHRRLHYFPNNRLVVNPSSTSYSVVAPDGRAAIYYTVKQGDAVGLIADWFNVRTSDLCYWNNISKNLIKVGQQLVIYVPKNKEEQYKRVAQERSAKTNVSTNRTVAVQSQKQTDSDSDYEYYEVKSGDTLWSISQKFPGVSNDDIIKLNNITDARKLKPGQKLKIRVIS